MMSSSPPVSATKRVTRADWWPPEYKCEVCDRIVPARIKRGQLRMCLECDRRLGGDKCRT